MLTQVCLPPLCIVDEGGQVGGPNNEWGGWVAGYGGDPDEDVDELVN